MVALVELRDLALWRSFLLLAMQEEKHHSELRSLLLAVQGELTIQDLSDIM
jgi:hypothetical protein